MQLNVAFREGLSQESYSEPVRFSGYSKQRANLGGRKYLSCQYNSKGSYRHTHANMQLPLCVTRLPNLFNANNILEPRYLIF